MRAIDTTSGKRFLPSTWRFSWDSLGWILIAAPLVGLVFAWIGHRVQADFAPLILFPILLGTAVGITIVGLIRFAQFGNRSAIFAAVVVAATTAPLGEHYFGYLSAYPGFQVAGSASSSDHSSLVRQVAPSFGAYLQAQAARGRPLWGDVVAHGVFAWVSWALDAALTVVAAILVTLPALRVPYCSRCGTWYRTTRNGKVDLTTGRRLAEICGIEDIASLHSPRYRLAVCQGGCGPMRCELSWEESSNAVSVARVWLTSEQRRQIAEVLDGLSEEFRPIDE